MPTTNRYVSEGETTFIHLKSGLTILLDTADVPLVVSHFWYGKPQGGRFYAAADNRNGPPCRHLMHRLIMGAKPGQIVDHKNRNSLDNRRENLRFCTVSQNTANSRRHQDSRYPYRGVSLRYGKWQAYIRKNGNYHSLGAYIDIEDAARAYDRKALELFGEFAVLNFPS